MVQEVQVAAFEGGSLRLLASGVKSREAVLALPLSRLVVRMVRVPAGEDPVAVAAPLLQEANPFPDEPLTVGCEVVRETESGSVVIAAALPESAADDVGEALDAAKLNVTRVDALVLGQLRGAWGAIGVDGAAPQRKAVIARSPDCDSIVVMDGDQPVSIRAASAGADMRREFMLSLLEAEDFGGEMPLSEIVVIERDASEASGTPDESQDAQATQDSLAPQAPDFDSLAAFAPVRRVTVGADAALVGVAERSADPMSLNALPASWAEVLAETRFKAKLVKYVSVAVGIWALAMGVLFGVPVVYGFMTDSQKTETKRHHSKFLEVKKMVDKVNLVRKYSDRAHSALELMKAVSDRMPPNDVTLSDWEYKRDKGIVVRGDAGQSSAVYAFKDAMEAMTFGEGEDAVRVFGAVNMGPVGSAKGGRVRFSLELDFPAEGEGWR